MLVFLPTTLRLYSYLKIDTHYEVPLRMLKEEVDCYGSPLMLRLRHHGGIRHLQSYLKQREKGRESERIIRQHTRMVSEQSLEGVFLEGCGG
jgi:hypothetical protein